MLEGSPTDDINLEQLIEKYCKQEFGDRTCYKNSGASYKATNDEIKKAAQNKLKGIINEIKKAYSILENTKRRNEHDRNSFVLPDMVCLPDGTFQMGNFMEDGEKPVHEVTVKSFFIGRFPVTFDEYNLFAEAAGREKPNDNGWGRGDRPVIDISWDDATAYAEWLNGQTGHEYRLPTEAEWEYAARADSDMAYAFGNDKSMLGEYAWYWDNSEAKTHPVGRKKPNIWGLYDMYGNIWEWVQDWYSDYSGEALTNPSGPMTGSYRVMRGGSWNLAAGCCRSSVRVPRHPVNRDPGAGFRLARTYA